MVDWSTGETVLFFFPLSLCCILATACTFLAIQLYKPSCCGLKSKKPDEKGIDEHNLTEKADTMADTEGGKMGSTRNSAIDPFTMEQTLRSKTDLSHYEFVMPDDESKRFVIEISPDPKSPMNLYQIEEGSQGDVVTLMKSEDKTMRNLPLHRSSSPVISQNHAQRASLLAAPPILLESNRNLSATAFTNASPDLMPLSAPSRDTSPFLLGESKNQLNNSKNNISPYTSFVPGEVTGSTIFPQRSSSIGSPTRRVVFEDEPKNTANDSDLMLASEHQNSFRRSLGAFGIIPETNFNYVNNSLKGPSVKDETFEYAEKSRGSTFLNADEFIRTPQYQSTDGIGNVDVWLEAADSRRTLSRRSINESHRATIRNAGPGVYVVDNKSGEITVSSSNPQNNIPSSNFRVAANPNVEFDVHAGLSKWEPNISGRTFATHSGAVEVEGFQALMERETSNRAAAMSQFGLSSQLAQSPLKNNNSTAASSVQASHSTKPIVNMTVPPQNMNMKVNEDSLAAGNSSRNPHIMPRDLNIISNPNMKVNTNPQSSTYSNNQPISSRSMSPSQKHQQQQSQSDFHFFPHVSQNTPSDRSNNNLNDNNKVSNKNLQMSYQKVFTPSNHNINSPTNIDHDFSLRDNFATPNQSALHAPLPLGITSLSSPDRGSEFGINGGVKGMMEQIEHDRKVEIMQDMAKSPLRQVLSPAALRSETIKQRSKEDVRDFMTNLEGILTSNSGGLSPQGIYEATNTIAKLDSNIRIMVDKSEASPSFLTGRGSTDNNKAVSPKPQLKKPNSSMHANVQQVPIIPIQINHHIQGTVNSPQRHNIADDKLSSVASPVRHNPSSAQVVKADNLQSPPKAKNYSPPKATQGNRPPLNTYQKIHNTEFDVWREEMPTSAAPSRFLKSAAPSFNSPLTRQNVQSGGVSHTSNAPLQLSGIDTQPNNNNNQSDVNSISSLFNKSLSPSPKKPSIQHNNPPVLSSTPLTARSSISRAVAAVHHAREHLLAERMEEDLRKEEILLTQKSNPSEIISSRTFNSKTASIAGSYMEGDLNEGENDVYTFTTIQTQNLVHSVLTKALNEVTQSSPRSPLARRCRKLLLGKESKHKEKQRQLIQDCTNAALTEVENLQKNILLK